MKRLLPAAVLLLLVSCGAPAVLVIPDPLTDEGASPLSFGEKIRASRAFRRAGLRAEFAVSPEEPAEWAPWLTERLAGGVYEALVLPYSFYAYRDQFEFKGGKILFVGAAAPPVGSDAGFVLLSRENALEEAGRRLKEWWLREERLPAAVLWSGPGGEGAWDALLRGWGDRREVLTARTLLLDEAGGSREALTGFFDRLSGPPGPRSLAVAADPVLADVLALWPAEEDLRGILASAENPLLPETAAYLIRRDPAAEWDAAAALLQGRAPLGSLPAEALFQKR